MTAKRKISYSDLLGFLNQEIDRRYKNKNMGVWRTQQVIDQNTEQKAQMDDWFNLNRLLKMKEAQSVLKSFCDQRRSLKSAREIREFLTFELETFDGDLLFRMTRLRNSELLGHLIALYRDQVVSSLTSGKTLGRPRTTEGRNKLMHDICKEFKCTYVDPRVWLNFKARAERKLLPIPNRSGLSKHKWMSMPDDEERKAQSTVFRQYRDHLENQN